MMVHKKELCNNYVNKIYYKKKSIDYLVFLIKCQTGSG